MDDAGKGTDPLDGFKPHTVALGLQPVAPGGLHDVARPGAVPRYAAVHTNLFQRHPLPVAGQHHCQTGCAALQRLHLHDHRHLCNLALSGWTEVFFTHMFHRLS